LDINPWTDHNPKDFVYLTEKYKCWYTLEKEVDISTAGSAEDYEKGFMRAYGQTDFENDFNEYSAVIFTYPEKFKEIMNQYPRVRGKFMVWLEFHQKIDPIFTEEYLLGEAENPPIPDGPHQNSKVKPMRHRVLVRYPEILQKSFDKYPVEIIKMYLNRIHFAGEIDQAGFKFGGSYDPFRRIVYLIDNGENNDEQAMSTFHHEFSSLLRKSHSFWIDPWTDHHPEGFKYLSDRTGFTQKIYNNTSLVGTDDDFEKGFMNSYGQTCFENDFEEYSAMIFTNPQKFKEIMNQYPRVRGKFKVWLEFYQKIDPIFTEEYLLGERENGTKHAQP
jgi:hypothetical protein